MASVLTEAELGFAAKIMKQWCIPVDLPTKSWVLRLLTLGSKSSSYTKRWVQKIRDLGVSWILDDMELCNSAFLYYASGLLVAFCNYRQLVAIHGSRFLEVVESRVIRLGLLCLISDLIMDSDDSKVTVDQMRDLLHKPEILTPDHRLKAAHGFLISLISEVPKATPVLFLAFEAQVQSIRQTNPETSDITGIEKSKSARSLDLLGYILNDGHCLAIDPSLGYLIQIQDDLADLDLDLKSGIRTLVSLELETSRSLDRCILEALTQVQKLNCQYWPFKIIATYFLAALGSASPHTSIPVRQILASYNPSLNRGIDTEATPLYRRALYRFLVGNEILT